MFKVYLDIAFDLLQTEGDVKSKARKKAVGELMRFNRIKSDEKK